MKKFIVSVNAWVTVKAESVDAAWQVVNNAVAPELVDKLETIGTDVDVIVEEPVTGYEF